MGKTSLLARGLQRARLQSMKIVLTDFESYTEDQLATPDTLLLSLAGDLADQLELEALPDATWNPMFSASRNLERYLRREVMGTLSGPLVWGMDEVDRLFPYNYAASIFGLFRSWHNRRALDPDGLWARLSLAMSYSTEVQMFITDLDQSPFNVGTRLTLQDFTADEVAELNRRYGLPLRNAEEVMRYHGLLNGHPYLVRKGFAVLTMQSVTLRELEAQADRPEGPYGDHLRHLLALISRDRALKQAVSSVLEGNPCLSTEQFYRLRSAGILAGAAAEESEMRCPLYDRYLRRRLL